MKILHIWDIAGVSSTIAYYQKRLGVDVTVAYRKNADVFGISSFYNIDNMCLDLSPIDFYLWIKNNIKDYDILHIHALTSFLLPYLKLRYPKKKIIYHLHGGEFSFNLRKKARVWRELSILMADKVFVATTDMLKYSRYGKEFVWIPTPIDTDHFKPDTSTKDKCLYVEIPYIDNDKVLDYVFQKYPELKDNLYILKRQRTDSNNKIVPAEYIDYSVYPRFLTKFEYMIDVKIINGRLIKAMSRNGLEALACGVKVINYNLEIITKLPQFHNAKNVSRYVLEQYDF